MSTRIVRIISNSRAGTLYHGRRGENGTSVYVVPWKAEAYPLPPRHDLRNHSPTGLEWGYCGSGPAQLALALLAHAVGDDIALECYHDFKCEIVAGLVEDDWELALELIEGWLADKLIKREV